MKSKLLVALAKVLYWFGIAVDVPALHTALVSEGYIYHCYNGTRKVYKKGKSVICVNAKK